jgi:hypothetical protein
MDFPHNLDKLAFSVTLADVEAVPQGRPETLEEWQQTVRRACLTNTRFLANCILRPPRVKKLPPLVEKVHGQIIDSFLKPNPDTDWDEWDSLDEFVTMASRGMLKSTLGAALLTQLILCCPDIRILIISGKMDKAESILAMARDPFLSNEVLRFLFPEWAIDIDAVTAETFTTPRRNPALLLRDPTIAIGSFDSVKTGGHHEVILFDDATNENNSNNIENCEKTHALYDACEPLIEPGGYRLFLGTKWHGEDLPEYIMRNSDNEKEKTGAACAKHFVLPAWKLREDGTPRELTERENREKTGSLTPDDVILTWPEKLKAKYLFRLYNKNRADFYKQYLLDASLEQQASFTKQVMDRQITSPTDWNCIPVHDRAVVVHWDFASVWSGRRQKSENDYSCGIVAGFQKSTGKMWVLNAMLAHFVSGDEMAGAVIRLYQSAMQQGVIVGHSMEDAVGIRAVESSILRVAKEAEVPMMSINFVLPQKGTKGGGNVKNSNIALLASAMRGPRNEKTREYERGTVFINSNIPFLEEIKTQFEKWSIDAKRRKDDAPDCIAQILKIYAPIIHADTVTVMEPDGPVLSWEPNEFEKPETPETGASDAADNDYLADDTVTFLA